MPLENNASSVAALVFKGEFRTTFGQLSIMSPEFRCLPGLQNDAKRGPEKPKWCAFNVNPDYELDTKLLELMVI